MKFKLINKDGFSCTFQYAENELIEIRIFTGKLEKAMNELKKMFRHDDVFVDLEGWDD